MSKKSSSNVVVKKDKKIDIKRFMDLMFYRNNCIFRHLYDSYDKFIDEDMPNYLENDEHIFYEKIKDDTKITYKFVFSNIQIKPPMLSNDAEPLFPSKARRENMTYQIRVFGDVTQIEEHHNIHDGKKVSKINGDPEKNVLIAYLPLMVRSKYCSLSLYEYSDKEECDYDAGGYFITNGNEKVLICQDRMVDNKALLFNKKDIGLYVQVNSKSSSYNGMVQGISLRIDKNNIVWVSVKIFKDIPAVVLLKALGLETDKDIVSMVVGDYNDVEMIDLLRKSLNACKTHNDEKISSTEDAILYMTSMMRIITKNKNEDSITEIDELKLNVVHQLKNKLFPHIDVSTPDVLRSKAYYLCHMINKLLKGSLKRIPLDDRDSYVNKRIDTPGVLMYDLFRQQFKKMISECKKYFEQRGLKDEANPQVIINNIKPNIISQGIVGSLSTGDWINHKGVAQVLQRLSYMYTISLLRRVDTTLLDQSAKKIIQLRHLHPSSVGFLCCAETPEHEKIGLIKHLSMVGSITIMSLEQYKVIHNYLLENTIHLYKISPDDYVSNNKLYKVFLNGNWIGMTEKVNELYNDMEKKRLNLMFDMMNTSVIRDDENYEFRVYCDNGRLNRPVLIVENNEINLKNNHIDMIQLNKQDPSKISNYYDFLVKNPNIIDYIDSEKQPYVLVSDTMKNVKEMRKRMKNAKEYVKEVLDTKNLNILNRYDQYSYKKYNYCEIHPALLLGEITTNTPFVNMNVGPRIIFNYAQSRQAPNVYSTVYRDRTDISYIPYKSQAPLVFTKTANYTNTLILPQGENCMMTIAIYTGFNQEDSAVFSKTAIQRGKFITQNLKKFSSQIQKNQSSSQDDKFMKPDPTKTSVKQANYEKLNDAGFVPQETVLEYGDVFVGKVTPITSVSASSKPFKDSSEIYKNTRRGVMDRIYTNTVNQDGQEVIKGIIRAECDVMNGDKFASRHGQNFYPKTFKLVWMR